MRTTPTEPLRNFLIREVTRFVQQAREISGVHRIALIGSLTTAKHNPKDADLLLSVDDDAALAPLASAGRQLKGRAQSRNSGADIFLADAGGNYLGRICHWRDCEPGIRIACNACNCGRRQYLCDDLDVLSLPAALIEAPPLELWPLVVRRRPIPTDLENMITQVTSSHVNRSPYHGRPARVCDNQVTTVPLSSTSPTRPGRP